MQLPRVVLLPVTVALTALAYYLILFTNWSNFYLGASFPRLAATQAVIVLAVFSCMEVMRSEKAVAVRALAGAVGVPLALVTLLLLWLGVRRYVVG